MTDDATKGGDRPTASRPWHVTAALGVVAVPLVGWFVGDWSGATTLVVYWFETVAGCLLVAGRAMLHRRWNPRRGHFDYRAREDRSRRTTFVSGFLLVALSFSAAHAVFLGAVLVLLRQNRVADLATVDWRGVGAGCAAVLAFLVVGFLLDLTSLRRWTFGAVEEMATRGVGRVIVVHVTILVGFVGIALTEASAAFFGTFVVLRSLFALGTVVPQYDPATPPRWLSTLLDRVPGARPGQRFEDFWARDRAAELARRERNEQPWPS